jgi:hypothetical protein
MRRSPKNVKIAFNHRGLTHYGGIYFFHEFTRVLPLRDFLSRHLTYHRPRYDYSLPQMLLALIYPILLGLDRLETASFLRTNGCQPATQQSATRHLECDFAALGRAASSSLSVDVSRAFRPKNMRLARARAASSRPIRQPGCPPLRA